MRRRRSVEEARGAAVRFAISGTPVEIVPFERGHIHDTYIVTFRSEEDGDRRFLLQRINDRVFQDVPALMHNVELVTGHLGNGHVAGGLEPLTLVRTWAGGWYFADGSGAWRVYHFLEGTESFDRCRDTRQAHAAAHAFGDFQACLLELTADSLRETIPHFFSSPYRLRQLKDAIEQNPLGRVEDARAEIEFVTARGEEVPRMDKHLAYCQFPLRVIHGDTKLNNVLFDVESGAARAICDLDTCMPGWSLYDFGDLVRFTAATSSEDETDLSRVGVDMELYGALVDGYQRAAAFLTPIERELMPFAARLVTLTVGMRFLADYISGDRYFKIDDERPNHNLERARVQFAMVADMETQREAMRTG